ncbi:NTF2 fold immunity protein [Asticcacaulis sp.]|uniref:NTF2 fold immunity protein n=1 Tax=Asticcacaulis sp. TaxID=1872648 RepID=UPI002C5B1353|nr:NTF2 fold immunity protein [Asticcacaulis sp.]HTM82239.1 NTF2 fold immunity protein [Asticcacaulis sp.]
MPRRKISTYILMMFLIPLSLTFAPHHSLAHTYKPPGGYVQSADVAIAIAEVILESIYGEKQIKSEKPLTATLTKEGIWVVKGTLKKNHKGGVAEIWISKEDGTIVNVTHGL